MTSIVTPYLLVGESKLMERSIGAFGTVTFEVKRHNMGFAAWAVFGSHRTAFASRYSDEGQDSIFADVEAIDEARLRQCLLNDITHAEMDAEHHLILQQEAQQKAEMLRKLLPTEERTTT